MKKILLAFFILILGISLAGCTTSTLRAANVTVPVSVGPVLKIKGQPDKPQGKMDFDMSAESIGGATGGSVQIVVKTKETSEKFDVELLKLTAVYPADRIAVSEIYFGSYFFAAGGVIEKVWTGIKGVVYEPVLKK